MDLYRQALGYEQKGRIVVELMKYSTSLSDGSPL